MDMQSDVEISQQATLKPIVEIAEQLGIKRDAIELYGDFKAKINVNKIPDYEERPEGKLILVTAMTPTPAGKEKQP